MDTLFLNTPSASVSPGAIILLLPDEITKYILKYGYFKYNSEVSQLGWYIIKISDSSLLPVTDDIIPNIKPYVTDNSTSVCCCDGTLRPPKPTAFTDELKNQTVRSFITVDTIADRDALLTLDSGIVDGRLVRVNRATSEGESKYYRYDSTTQEWIQEKINQQTVDSVLSDTSENPVQNKTIKAALGGKVDKIEGYRMMSPDEASKLESLVAGEGGNVPNIEIINGGNANGNT